MIEPSTVIPASWADCIAGRRVAIARFPPSPIVNPRTTLRLYLRMLACLVGAIFSLACGYGAAVVTGYWWLGVVVFPLSAMVAAVLGISFINAVKDAHHARRRAREQALDDPIGRLLLACTTSRRARLDPASYAELLALPQRPVLILDHALLELLDFPKAMDALAPRGSLPEPETLGISKGTPGLSLMMATLLIPVLFMTEESWRALINGVPLSWMNWFGIAFVIGVLLPIVFDPLLHQKLGMQGFITAPATIGAGWLREGRGKLWTVDDSMMIVCVNSAYVELRCITSDKVEAYYLSMRLPQERDSTIAQVPKNKPFQAIRDVLRQTSAHAAQSVGIENVSERQGAKSGAWPPLHLMLSSWAHPEPRTELASQE
jgi:membrane protein implicated in regulation of membrane protease activity